MPIFILIGLIVVSVVIYVKLKNSTKFDKFCKDLMSDDPIVDSTKNKIEDIVSAERDLGKKVKQNTKEADKLSKESSGINDFLGKRGVEVAEKKEDS